MLIDLLLCDSESNSIIFCKGTFFSFSTVNSNFFRRLSSVEIAFLSNLSSKLGDTGS